MNDVEVYGKLIERFIVKMTSPKIGQFKLEISTFRIILERARADQPSLVKFTIMDSGKIVNNLKDDTSSITALSEFLQRSIDFISSLIGEELAIDIISSSMTDEIESLGPYLKGKKKLQEQIPEPFGSVISNAIEKGGKKSDHEEIIDLFTEVFQAYLKDLSVHTDLSAFKLKLSILREKHHLLKHVELIPGPELKIDSEEWSSGTVDEVSGALIAMFNSLVGLSTFLLGREEAFKKATRIFLYYFDGKDRILERYDILDNILDGSLHSKVTTGIEILDKKMGGGIPKGASILLISPSGIERDIFISNLMKRGLNSGSSALWVLSKEPPRSIKMLLRSNDLDPDDLEEKDRLRIVDWFSWRGERIIGVEREGKALRSSKILSNLGIAISKGLRELTYSSTKIGIVHMIGPAMNIFEFNQVYKFIDKLRAKFKDDEMSSIFLLETDTITKEIESKIMEVFDGTLEITKNMADGSFRREIQIKSLAGIDFDANPLPFIIKENMIIPDVEMALDEEIWHIDPDDDDEVEVVITTKPKKKAKKVSKKPRRIRRFKRTLEDDPSDEKVKVTLPDANQKNQKKKVPAPDPSIKQKKKIKRVMRKTKSTSGLIDIDGIDLGIDENQSEDILKEAIDTIDQLLEEDDPDMIVVNSRKRIK